MFQTENRTDAVFIVSRRLRIRYDKSINELHHGKEGECIKRMDQRIIFTVRGVGQYLRF